MDQSTQKTSDLKLHDEEEHKKGLAAFKFAYHNYLEEVVRFNMAESSAFDTLTSAFFKCQLPAKGSQLSYQCTEQNGTEWYVWWLEGPLQNYKVRTRCTWTETLGYRVEVEERVSETSRGWYRMDTVQEAFDILSEFLQRIKNEPAKDPFDLFTVVWVEKSKNRVVPKESKDGKEQ